MLKGLNEFKALLQKEVTLKKEKEKLLSKIIFTSTIVLHKIPKSEKVLVETIKSVLMLNAHKYKWIDLSIYDSFLDGVYIFGREKDIFHDIARITKMIVLRQECMIGYTSVSLTPGGNSHSLKRFI